MEANEMLSANSIARIPTASATTGQSAITLARKIASGELNAIDVVEAHIARIEAVNPALNAVVWKRYDAARAEAREIDRRRAAGEKLPPLAGVPVTIKECLDLEGAPSTFGVSHRKNHVAEADELHVARLRKAGAIVLGKTNMAQLLLFLETDNPVYGRTQNPHNLERSPGGSSGGEAAILQAAGSALGLGTDIGGSSRVPAAFCGIIGYKPTPGLMPDFGIGSVPVGQQAIASQVGVLGRSAADVRLACEIASERPLVSDKPLSTVRVGWFDNDGLFAPCPAARRAVREAAAALEKQGLTVRKVDAPDAKQIYRFFYGAFAADSFKGMARFLGKSPRDARIKLIEDAATKPRFIVNLILALSGRQKTKGVVAEMQPRDADAYFTLVAELLAFRRRTLEALADVDVLLSPPVALPAVRHGACAELGVMGTYSCVYNVLGWPAGVMPWTEVQSGEESDRAPSTDKMDLAALASEQGSTGLPIGVQVAAKPGMDAICLDVMNALERGKSN